MKGPYIIGIYGRQKSTYTISITAEKYPMVMIIENHALSKTQENFEIAYYEYYNWQDEDIKLTLSVRSGEADMYISTFSEIDSSQNLVSRLPKSKRNAFWVLESVSPLSSASHSEFLLVKEERKFCTSCVFLIAVVTHEKQAQY